MAFSPSNLFQNITVDFFSSLLSLSLPCIPPNPLASQGEKRVHQKEVRLLVMTHKGFLVFEPLRVGGNPLNPLKKEKKGRHT